MLTPRLYIRRTARILNRGGFTLVELLVVIGIIAILAGVALGPITNGIKKAKQSSGMQSAHAIGLGMYSAANDNSQTYPDASGGDASNIAKTLLSGGYVTDPSIFFISGGVATKFNGTAASAISNIAKANMSWDFAGNGGAGLVSTSYVYLPLLWSSIANGTEPTLTAGANSPILATPASPPVAPFGTDGLAIFYINNSAKFVTSQASGSTLQVTMVTAANNSGEASTSAASANVLQGGD